MAARIDFSFGRPIQGVSQQAEALRGRGQCTEQENYIPDPVYGLRRRPPTVHVDTLGTYNTYVDFTDNEGDKQLAFNDSAVAIVGLDGTETSVTVTDTAAFNYLKFASSVSNRINAVFFKDDLYITNREVTVLEDTGYTAPTRRGDKFAVVKCLGGQYDRQYQVDVTVQGVTYSGSFTTRNGSNTSHSDDIKSTTIIDELYTSLTAHSELTVEKHLDHLLITPTNGGHSLDAVAVTDDADNSSLVATHKSVKSIEDLPNFAPDNWVVKIAGQDGSEDDSYFEYIAATGSAANGFGNGGSWIESSKIGDEFEFDVSTLPVVIKNIYTTPSLELADWRGREIGDEESNETPSILGNKVKDVKVMQGRLVLLGTSSLIFSRIDRPLEMWRQTILGGIQDDDAIDGSSDVETGEYTHLVKTAQDLGVWARQGQYVISGSTNITPSNIALSLTTRASSIPSVPPIGIAGNIYFATDNGDFSGLSEYYKEDLNYFDLPVSTHVPRYVEGTVTAIKGSQAQRMVAIKTDALERTLYCYKFLVVGNERRQSAWFKISFGYDIKHFTFSGNSMYLITASPFGDVLERIDFEKIVEGDLNFTVHLDRQKEYTLDADAKFTPDSIHTVDSPVFVNMTSDERGLTVECTEDGADLEPANGEQGDVVLAGFRYTSLYTPTKPRYFDANKEVVNVGTLRISKLLVNVEDSGAFDWEVETDWGQTTSGEISARIWDDAENQYSRQPLLTRQWSIPWSGKAEDRECTISCNAHTPHNIQYLEAVGRIERNRRRVT